VGSAFTAAYDSDNRLTNLSYAGNQITFSYLGNILLKKTVNGVETRYVYDGFQIMQERNANNTLVNEYTYGLGLPGGIGGLLRLNQGGTPYSYLFDGKSNVTASFSGLVCWKSFTSKGVAPSGHKVRGSATPSYHCGQFNPTRSTPLLPPALRRNFWRL
jgi:YD repeat-containing protein